MLEKSLKNDGFGVCLNEESRTKELPVCLCHHHAVGPFSCTLHWMLGNKINACHAVGSCRWWIKGLMVSSSVFKKAQGVILGSINSVLPHRLVLWCKLTVTSCKPVGDKPKANRLTLPWWSCHASCSPLQLPWLRSCRATEWPVHKG